MADYMALKPVSIHPDEPLSEALALMIEHGIHHLPVVEDGQLVGILSDRDLRKIWRRNREGALTPAGDVDLQECVSTRMSHPPICIKGTVPCEFESESLGPAVKVPSRLRACSPSRFGRSAHKTAPFHNRELPGWRHRLHTPNILRSE
jgi:hypothetical protein